MLVEGRIETTAVNECYVCLVPVGLDMAAKAVHISESICRPAAYSTNDRLLNQIISCLEMDQ